MRSVPRIPILLSVSLVVLCGLWPSHSVWGKTQSESIGALTAFDPRFFRLIPETLKVEKIADGFSWVEGPVWNDSGNFLLFSDIPSNSIYRWSYVTGTKLFLRPSGYSGEGKFTGRQPGSNGLAFDRQGRLIICQHGDRRIIRIESDGTRTVLVDRFKDKRLNSPNDLAIRSNGDIYFTDPPYGLARGFRDPEKELPFQGIFRVTESGKVDLLSRDIKAPNGLVFSPDETILYVTNSDGNRSGWLAFDVNEQGKLSHMRLFFDARRLKGKRKGAPDGLTVDQNGNLFSAGPGGIYVFAPDGVLLGFIELGGATSNVTWGEDGSVLFVTAGAAVYRIPLHTKGLAIP